MKNKNRRRKTRKKRKGAGMKVYPGCEKFKNTIKRLKEENLRLKREVSRARPSWSRVTGTPGAVGDPRWRRSERDTLEAFGSPLSPGSGPPRVPRTPRSGRRILWGSSGGRSRRRRRRGRKRRRSRKKRRKRRKSRTRRRKQRGGFGGGMVGKIASFFGGKKKAPGGSPSKGGLAKAAPKKLSNGDFPEGDSDAPGVPELPKEFGDALEKGLKFIGKPGIPTSDRNLDVKGSEGANLPKTVFTGKLDPPIWSEDLRANFRNFDKFINNDTQILFEKK